MSYDAPSTFPPLRPQFGGAKQPAFGRKPQITHTAPKPKPTPKAAPIKEIPKPVPPPETVEPKVLTPSDPANVFSILQERGEEDEVEANICVVNDLRFVATGALGVSGFVYKQHFRPYRPTREQLDAALRSLPEKKPKKQKPTKVTITTENSQIDARDKGKEKVDDDVPSEEQVDIFMDESKIAKPKEHIDEILYKGKSVFFEEDDVVADTFFVDESKVVPTELEFKVPESDSAKFLVGFEPATSSTVSRQGTQGTNKEKDTKEQKKEERTTTKQKKANEEAKPQSLARKKPLEPEEEEIEKLASLMGQGFIPPDEFERRKTELLNDMKKRHALNLESEKERKRIEAEEKRKLQEAERKYKLAKLEEERLWASKEKLRAHQMKLKLMAEEGLNAKLSFDDDNDPVADPSGIDLDKILQCVQDSGVAMQIYEYLVSHQGKTNTRKAKMSDMHDVQHILAAHKGPNSKKLNSMADVLHVLHVSGRSGTSVVTSSHPQLSRSQVLPTRENMHYIENIANKDPAMVQCFLKQIKKERKLRLRYQQELQAWRLAVSDNAAF